MSEARSDGATLMGFAIMCVLIGFNFIAVRVSNFELDPFWGATLRYVVATLLLVGLMRLRRVGLPRGVALRTSVVYGILNFAGLYGLMYWALVVVPAGMASVVLAAAPLVTYLFAMGFRLERFVWPALLGALVVIVGVAVIGWEGAAREVPPLRFAAVVLAVVSTSLAGIVVKRGPAVHPFAMNAVGMGAGALLLGVMTWLAGDSAVLPQEPRVRLAVAYLIVASVTMFVLFVWLVRRWTASGVAYAGVLAPIVTVVAAHFLLDEPITTRFLLGAVLIAGGVYWGALRPRPVASSVAPAEPEPVAGMLEGPARPKV